MQILPAGHGCGANSIHMNESGVDGARMGSGSLVAIEITSTEGSSNQSHFISKPRATIALCRDYFLPKGDNAMPSADPQPAVCTLGRSLLAAGIAEARLRATIGTWHVDSASLLADCLDIAKLSRAHCIGEFDQFVDSLTCVHDTTSALIGFGGAA